MGGYHTQGRLGSQRLTRAMHGRYSLAQEVANTLVGSDRSPGGAHVGLGLDVRCGEYQTTTKWRCGDT
jgi:hypothetical protein